MIVETIERYFDVKNIYLIVIYIFRRGGVELNFEEGIKLPPDMLGFNTGHVSVGIATTEQ